MYKVKRMHRQVLLNAQCSTKIIKINKSNSREFNQSLGPTPPRRLLESSHDVGNSLHSPSCLCVVRSDGLILNLFHYIVIGVISKSEWHRTETEVEKDILFQDFLQGEVPGQGFGSTAERGS